jgi:transcriptional regulator with XRE-family HTH domain
MAKSRFRNLLNRVPPNTRQLVRKQNEIADRIFRCIKQRNITQKEFAQQLGMKESQLCKILGGNANLTLKTIVKIETVLQEEIVKIARDDSSQFAS